VFSEKLSDLQYKLIEDSGVWARANYRGISYSDGSPVEERIFGIINNAADISCLSDELRQHCTDWPSTYHLSSMRGNLLHSIAGCLSGEVLEIGAGCGAVTRYLGELGSQVLALEGTHRRAKIARERTRDLENVTVICESFAEFDFKGKFDAVTLIGVLEYAQLFIDGDDPVGSMIAKAKSFLKPGGTLILAIENKLGLKYFAGFPEDHVGIPMFGIESRYESSGPVTFGRRELDAILLKQDFQYRYFLAPYPDYKTPLALVTQKGFDDNNFNVADFVFQAVGRNYQDAVVTPNFSQELAFEAIEGNRLGMDLANSFLVVASESECDAVPSNLLAEYYSAGGRNRRFFKLSKIFTEGGDILVDTQQPFYNVKFEAGRFRFHRLSADKYISGKLLVKDLVKLVSQDSWTFEELKNFFQSYRSALAATMDVEERVDFLELGLCPVDYLDALPHNLIQRPDGTFCLIDREWAFYDRVNFAWLIYRTLMMLPNQCTAFGRFATGEIWTWDLLAESITASLGLKIDTNLTDRLCALEAEFQSYVSGRPAEKILQNIRFWRSGQLNWSTKVTSRVVDFQINAGVAEAENVRLSSVIEQIHGSTSWKITRPLRGLVYAFRRVFSCYRLIKGSVKGGGIRLTLRKILFLFRMKGFGGILSRILNKFDKVESWIDYEDWHHFFYGLSSTQRRSLREISKGFDVQPLISIVMPVFNPDIEHLEQAINSVCNQVYQNWQLCIADDASTDPRVKTILDEFSSDDSRICVVYRDVNGHISAASNTALSIAEGEYIGLLDQDDLLTEDALYRVVEEIQNYPATNIFYSDEDKIGEDGVVFEPYFKSDFNYELFLSQNLISHFGVFRHQIVREIGGFRLGVEGSQDWDLALRVIAHSGTGHIRHIPRCLYHWRATKNSTADSIEAKPYAIEAAKKAVQNHAHELGWNCEVTHCPEFPVFLRIRHAVPKTQPSVAIIIPTRDKFNLLNACVTSILHKTRYKNYKVIIIDNGSTEEDSLAYLNEIQSPQVKVIRDDSEFNYSRINNRAVDSIDCDYICFLNNDVEVISPDWLDEMISFAQRDDVGAVGARLWYPNHTLQHGGIVLGMGGVASHGHHGLASGLPGYFGRASLHQEYSAVTGACLVVGYDKFKSVGGFDEGLAVAYNDVDLCLKLRMSGFRNIWTPYAELYHHESASRGYDDIAQNERFRTENQIMKDRWGGLIWNDPMYNPNLSLTSTGFELATAPRHLSSK